MGLCLLQPLRTFKIKASRAGQDSSGLKLCPDYQAATAQEQRQMVDDQTARLRADVHLEAATLHVLATAAAAAAGADSAAASSSTLLPHIVTAVHAGEVIQFGDHSECCCC